MFICSQRPNQSSALLISWFVMCLAAWHPYLLYLSLVSLLQEGLPPAPSRLTPCPTHWGGPIAPCRLALMTCAAALVHRSMRALCLPDAQPRMCGTSLAGVILLANSWQQLATKMLRKEADAGAITSDAFCSYCSDVAQLSCHVHNFHYHLLNGDDPVKSLLISWGGTSTSSMFAFLMWSTGSVIS